MFCKSCGKQINERSNFCKHCGIETKIKRGSSFVEVKNCPFCKEEIDVNHDKCPNCQRLLIEKMSFNNQSVGKVQKPVYDIILDVLLRIKKSFIGKMDYSKLLKYSVILLVIIFFIWAYSDDESSYNNEGAKTSLPPPTTQISDDSVDLTALIPAVSLTNGTILKKRTIYIRGDGELQIKNGTSLDAVAKLIRDGTSVLTVYIKANSTYTILNISDGIYWLAFGQGLDWDSTTQKFRRNKQYSVFEDTFDFITTYNQYTVFEVTLNPVIGGTAKTDDIPGSQFDQY